MPLHPAVRQTLADRLTVIQKELHDTVDVLRERELGLRRITEYREHLVEEKDAIRASLTDEPDTPAQAENRSEPAPRAEVHPEGVTPPPAERAPVITEEPTP